jgi:hypothetical protein
VPDTPGEFGRDVTASSFTSPKSFYGKVVATLISRLRIDGDRKMENQQIPRGRTSSKTVIAGRLRHIRIELFGEDGDQEIADQIGIPSRTWSNYEAGVTIPGEVLLQFLEITGVEPIWLLRGTGPKYRATMNEARGGTRGTVDPLARPRAPLL